MSKRRKDDEDYNPALEDTRPTKARKTKARKPRVKPLTSLKAKRFLTQHADEIWELVAANEGPTAIGDELCTRHGLRPGAIPARSVSNWLYYHKKAKKMKLPSVNRKNGNLRATDSCVYDVLLTCFIVAHF